MSAIHPAVFLNMWETSIPDWPYFLNSNGLRKNVPGNGKNGSMLRLLGGASPCRLASSGFGSKVSMWLAPPFMNSEITHFALGGKWGGLGLRGDPCALIISQIANPAMPPPPSQNRRRRDIPRGREWAFVRGLVRLH